MISDNCARTYGAPGTLVRAFSGLSESQLVGGPDWINAERFDIVATAGTNATPEQMRAMLQTLLADRFKLTMHTEKRTVSAFVLVMARTDKRLGPRLRGATAECGSEALLPGPPYPDGPPPCNWIGPGPRSAPSSGQPTMAFRGFSMGTFAAFLTPTVRRVVLDRTGLNPYFDGEFDMSAGLGPPPPPPGTADSVDRPSLPSIFTVLQEQLGLKLESTTAPVDVLAIDHVERPIPD